MELNPVLVGVFLIFLSMVVSSNSFFLQASNSNIVYYCSEYHPAPTAKSMAAPQGQLEVAEQFKFLIGG